MKNIEKIIKLLFIPLAITPFFLCSCTNKDIEKIGKEVGSRVNGENQILIEKLNKIINEQRKKLNTQEWNIENLKKQIENLHKDLENKEKYKQQDIDNYKEWYDKNEKKNYNKKLMKLTKKITTKKTNC